MKPYKRVPLSSYSILILISFCIWALSFIIPSGTFTYKNGDSILPSHQAIPLKTITSEQLVPILGSYHTLPQKSLSLWEFFQAPLKGAYEIIDFILFILILGVFIEILKSLRIFEKLCVLLVRYHCPPSLLLILFLFLLSLLSTITGLRDEHIMFFLILVPLLASYGISKNISSIMILSAASLGIASSIFNPTIVGIFASFSQEPLAKGAGIRTLVWFSGFIASSFVLWKLSPKTYVPSKTVDISTTQSSIISTFLSILGLLSAFIFLIRGLVSEYPLLQTAGGLLFLSIFAGILGGMKEHQIISSVKTGMQNSLLVTINMSIARGILYLMEKSEIRDTFLHGCFSVLGQDLPIWVFSIVFLLLITLGFFLINSTSAMASLAFPLLYPLFIQLQIPYTTFTLWFLISAGISQISNPMGFLLNHIRKETSLSYRQWVRYASPILWVLFFVWLISLVQL